MSESEPYRESIEALRAGHIWGFGPVGTFTHVYERG